MQWGVIDDLVLSILFFLFLYYNLYISILAHLADYSPIRRFQSWLVLALKVYFPQGTNLTLPHRKASLTSPDGLNSSDSLFLVLQGTTGMLGAAFVREGRNIGRAEHVQVHVCVMINGVGLHIGCVLVSACLQRRLALIGYPLHGGRLLLQVQHVLGRGQHLLEVPHELKVYQPQAYLDNKLRFHLALRDSWMAFS